MLEKLGTHEVETTAELFALANKCSKAAEAQAWHGLPPEQPTADKTGPSRSDKWEKKRKKHDTALVLPVEGAARRPACRAACEKKPPDQLARPHRVSVGVGSCRAAPEGA